MYVLLTSLHTSLLFILCWLYPSCDMTFFLCVFKMKYMCTWKIVRHIPSSPWNILYSLVIAKLRTSGKSRYIYIYIFIDRIHPVYWLSQEKWHIVNCSSHSPQLLFQIFFLSLFSICCRVCAQILMLKL